MQMPRLTLRQSVTQMKKQQPVPTSKASLSSWMAFLKASKFVAPEPTWKETPLTAAPTSLAACSAKRAHQHCCMSQSVRES